MKIKKNKCTATLLTVTFVMLYVLTGCGSGQKDGFDVETEITHEDISDFYQEDDGGMGDPPLFDFADEGREDDFFELVEAVEDIEEEEEPGEGICYESSLSSQSDTEAAGFSVRGGVWRDGGFAVDSTGDRIERTLEGDFNQGTIEFEALDLLKTIPYDPSSHGCERFVLNLNFHERDDPDHTRTVLANMATDCAGSPRGNLRVIFFGDGGFCCMDTRRLPDSSDGLWHHIKLTWDGSQFVLYVDGESWADNGYSSGTPGIDPYIWFGSESAPGDETHAVFRNLKICNYVY